ncbi:MAG: Bug family tripartite tricarboxylate transporter substrate binding protein, partial [Burkholderiaceae bacterium]
MNDPLSPSCDERRLSLSERRRLLVAALATAALPVPGLAQPARPAQSVRPAQSAQSATDFPSRPIRLVVPFAAGGGPDVLTRQLALRLGELLGQNVVVENKVGAGGIIAAELLAQAAPDGYTLMLGASSHVTQKLLQPSVKFDPLKSFAHIGCNSLSPSVLVVSAQSPWRTVQQLVDAARAAPGKLNYSSGGIGSAAHLSAAAFATAAGLDVVHVPYRGSVEIIPSIVNEAAQFAFPVSSTAVPQLQSGRVRALAITSAQRFPSLPEVPTLREVFGRDDLVLDAWMGIWAPAGLPEPVRSKLFEALNRVQEDAALRAVYEKAGALVRSSASPAEFTRFIESETA